MPTSICLKGWEKFQHYKDRDPPWVKLYRDLLTTESWVLGTDISRLVQVASILLAARYANKIPFVWDLLRKVASLECSEKQFNDAVQHLSQTNFLEIHQDDESASTELAGCASVLHGVYSEAEQRQSRAEQSPSARSAPGRRLVPRGTSVNEDGWFLDFKLAYPDRAGDQGWSKARRAANARMSEGHSTAEFVAGARRYAAYCHAAGKAGTEFVKQAATFLGPDKPFLLPWHPPPKPETASERILRKLNGTDDDRVIDHEPEAPALIAHR